jgi:hypothetical protein
MKHAQSTNLVLGRQFGERERGKIQLTSQHPRNALESARLAGQNWAVAATKHLTAEQMAKAQKDISVSEFFAKNRHLLGFDNKQKALLTTIKEAVDNSLDACEEAGISPD